jgi:DNA-binding transcriptional regulator LsrR (DeoR family)
MIATRLSLVYARGAVSLVGDPMLRERWPEMSPGGGDEVMRVIIGGCSRWEPDSAHARLLGEDIVALLNERRVTGDYLGVFLDEEANPIEPYLPAAHVSNIGSGQLYGYARRPDTLVVLVASLFMKLAPVKRALKAKLCNALVLDEHTASILIDQMRNGRA